MKNRKEQDYSRAIHGGDNTVKDEDVDAGKTEDYGNLRRGRHTELANDDGVPEQRKKGKGY